MSLVAVSNIRKEYRNKVVLADVSLQISRGERVALVGPNGAGKTTLLKIMMGQVKEDSGDVFLSKNVKVGYLSQYLTDLDESNDSALHLDALKNIEDEKRSLEEAMATMPDHMDLLLKKYEKVVEKFEQMDGYTLQSMIKKTLLGLGLSENELNKPLKFLSGGEKMRVALARILLESPELLILDEPTNHLDLHAIEWLEGFLNKFSGGVLIVSHDRYFLDAVTTRIAELRGGHLTTKKCNYSTFLDQKRQMKNFYLKAYRNIQKQIRHEKEMVVKLRKYKKIKQSQSRQKSLEKFEEKAKALLLDLKTTENLEKASGPQLDFKPIGHLSHEVMHCENLSKSFSNQRLFHGVDLTIYGGQKLALIGPNGCGKTTFINMMLGLDKDHEGTMKFGKWVDYAYLGQEVSFEDDNLSLLESLIKEGLEESEAKKSLSKLQFYGDVLNTRVADLSGGEKVRLILAIILNKAPQCLILDEPTNHLDLESRWAIEKALRDYKGTVIAVSHDRYFLNACVDKLLIVENHRITEFEGSYDAYKNQHTTKASHKEKVDHIKKSIQAYENRDYKTLTDEDYEHYEALEQALESMGETI